MRQAHDPAVRGGGIFHEHALMQDAGKVAVWRTPSKDCRTSRRE